MPRDQVRATPRSSPLGALADFLAKSYSPERTQQMQGVAKFLDMPAISETLDRLSYGEPLTTGAGGLGGTTRFRPEVLDAAIAVAPSAGALGKLAGQGALAAGRAGARLAERAVPRIMERGGVGADILQGMSRGTVSPMDVYHGSPYKFDKFDASKIGSGEGAQAYGHGIYTAELPGVAQVYKDTLAYKAFDVAPEAEKLGLKLNAGARGEFIRQAAVNKSPEAKAKSLQNANIAARDLPKEKLAKLFKAYEEQGGGNLYKVDLPDEQIAKMLDWDKPLNEQSPYVQAAIKASDHPMMKYWAKKSVENSAYNGADLLTRLAGEKSDRVNASELLRQAGIPGIKYLDATSRGAGTGTRNFVTFPGEEQNLTILERNGQPMVAPAVPEEHKMLQGFYRGYAGENLDTPELFVSPQKRIADYYADKRARQTGTEPHAEMLMVDPFAGVTYGHSTMGTGREPPMFTNARKIKPEDVVESTQLYQSGGVVKLLKSMLSGGEAAAVVAAEKALTAAQRAEAGRAAAALIKSQEQVKASEALGQQMEKGFKRTTTTQADRTRVGGGNIGGAPFPALSQADPAYAGKVWGVMDEGTASRLKNLTTPDTAWTTMLGSATQLKTNPVVFDKLKRQFIESMKQGNLSDELAGKINHNLSLTFGEGADIRDPGIWKLADTFEKRAALADAMMGQGIAPSKGGVALGGEKSGRGVIFRPTDTLIRETEPYLLPVEFGGNVPTYAAGPRLFSLEQESMYRPDLHPGFPTLIKGEDLGVNMAPTPTEVYLPDWHAKFKKDNPERQAPGYYDLALGVKNEGLPSQELNDEYIRHLLREGFAEGGAVHMEDGGAAFGVFPQMKPRRALQDREAAANAPLSALRGYAAGTAGLPGDIEGLARMAMSQVPSQFLNALPALRAFGIGSRADPTPQLPTTEFYNEYLPGAQLNATPTGKAFTTAGNALGGTGALRIAGLGVKGAKATGQALGPTAARMAEDYLQRQGLMPGVIKPFGGNFLTGRTEKDLKPLRQTTAAGSDATEILRQMREKYTPEAIASLPEHMRARIVGNIVDLEKDAALNKWVDSNLTNYVKKQMGTPDDPVRKLAEQGITHKPALLDEYLHEPFSGPQLRRAENVQEKRRKAGFPEEGLGQSPMAKAWELASDEVIATHRAGDIQGMPERYAKFQEAEQKMRTAREAVDRKFAQQMKNAGIEDPENGIYYGITSAEKAKIVGDTDLAKANAEYKSLQSPMMESYIRLGKENPWISKVNPETPVYTSFTNDLGFDHIMDVLREDVTAGRIRPDQLNKVSMEQAVRRTYEYDQELAAKANASRAAAREGLPTYKEYPEGYKWIELNQPGSFAQESEAMGHSVRGYEPPKGHPDWIEASGDAGSSSYGHGGWEAIKSGKAKVYSLVDPKGAPHATVEIKQIGMTPEQRQYKVGFLATQLEKEGQTAENALRQAEKIYPDELKESITQIKGKGNRAPNEEYLPYVQDFVKGGQWSGVNDLQNSGLLRIGDKYVDENKYREVAGNLNPDYISNLINNRVKDLSPDDAEIIRRLQEPEPGFAHGGLVSTHFDPIRIKQIIASLDDEYDPERIQQIVAQRESAYA